MPPNRWLFKAETKWRENNATRKEWELSRGGDKERRGVTRRTTDQWGREIHSLAWRRWGIWVTLLYHSTVAALPSRSCSVGRPTDWTYYKTAVFAVDKAVASNNPEDLKSRPVTEIRARTNGGIVGPRTPTGRATFATLAYTTGCHTYIFICIHIHVGLVKRIMVFTQSTKTADKAKMYIIIAMSSLSNFNDKQWWGGAGDVEWWGRPWHQLNPLLFFTPLLIKMIAISRGLATMLPACTSAYIIKWTGQDICSQLINLSFLGDRPRPRPTQKDTHKIGIFTRLKWANGRL